MANYIKDLDKTVPTDLDAVADGASEIRDVKTVLLNSFPEANSALLVSSESVNQAVQEDIPDLKRRLNALDGGSAGGGGIVASLKYNSVEIKYGHNIASVEMPAPGQGGGQYASCRVTFANQIAEFDNHYAVLIQPIATGQVNTQIIATINNQNADYVEFVWGVLEGGEWREPSGPPAFTLVVVDIEQTPV